ncbi:O-antigen ligase family protein [Thiobaca trueperi]|nr:O-antigen ligase family protein [Thiobaca trueperi]
MVVRATLFLAFYVLFFSNLAGLATHFQILGVSLTILAALFSLLTGQVRRQPMSPGEVMMVAIVALSSFSGIWALDHETVLYSLIFGAVFFAVGILRRYMTLAEVMQVCGLSFLIVMATVIVTDLPSFLRGLTGDVVYGIGLFRYSPFDLHPNLVGFIFGAGAVLLYQIGLTKQGPMKAFYLAASLLCFSFVLAASSRAGMLATVGAFVIYKMLGVKLRFSKNAPIQMIVVGSLLGILGIGLLVYLPTITEYIIRITDLDNPLRGLESGGTGRTDKWLLSIDVINSRDLLELLFGTGIRSSSADKIGYSVESSYFTLALENGLFLAALWVFASIDAMLRLGVSRDPQTPWKSAASILLAFALLQSMFNRYLLGVGNPVSLLLLFIYAETFFHAYKPGICSSQSLPMLPSTRGLHPPQ